MTRADRRKRWPGRRYYLSGRGLHGANVNTRAILDMTSQF